MFGNGRFFHKQVDLLSKVCGSRPTARHCNLDSQPVPGVVIPKRIERGPTDILKALSLTVGKDFTGFEYKYLDDPFLYPLTRGNKATYALSLESGRNSAKWVINENKKFFKNQLSEPPIKEFIPQMAKKTETEGTEEELLNAISTRDVLGAMEIYEVLKSKEISIENSTKQSLLELVCFYNSKKRPNLDVEENWVEGNNLIERKRVSDKQNSFAEKLFAEMDPNCPLANAAIIQGLLRHGKISKGMLIYKKSKLNNMRCPVNMYNVLLWTAPEIVQNFGQINKFVEDILFEMANKKVAPNLDTLNSALRALSKTKNKEFVDNLWEELTGVGIKPSLGSYGYLFLAYSRSRRHHETPENSNRKKTVEILENLMRMNFEVVHPSDLEFFQNAMLAASLGFNDDYLAVKLHEMLWQPHFRKFMPNFRVLSDIYKNLLILAFNKGNFDNAMALYKTCAITVFTPDMFVYEIIIGKIGDNYASKDLVTVWNDIQAVGLSNNNMVLKKLLSLKKDFINETTAEVFLQVADSYLNLIMDEYKSFTDVLPPNLLHIFTLNDQERKVLTLLKYINENNKVFSVSMDDEIKSVYEYGLSKKNSDIIIESLIFAQREDCPFVIEMAKNALPFVKENSKDWLKQVIVGVRTHVQKSFQPD